MGIAIRNKTLFSMITNERLLEDNQSDIFDVFADFKKYFAKEEYLNKFLQIIKESVEVRRKEKEMKISLPISSWINKTDNSEIIFNEMLAKYKKYSNPGIYDINFSDKLESPEIKKLLLLLSEED